MESGHFDSPAKPINAPQKTLDVVMQLSNSATSTLQQAAHQEPMTAIKIKWFSNNHNEGRFTRRYLCLVERPLRESSAIIMELQAASWSRVSRAVTRWAASRAACAGCRRRQSHITEGRAWAPELSCTNLVIMRRALVIEAEIFKLPKGFRCSVPIKFNRMRGSKSHPQ